MARRDQTLYRDESDKMLGGVCSGLGEYFDIDTNLVRVAFVALATFGGGGVVAYVILWAILDPKPMAPPLEVEPMATVPDIDLNEPARLSEEPAAPPTSESTEREAEKATGQTPPQ